MLKSEYSSVQQHLEAKHIQGIIALVPPDWNGVKPIIDGVKANIAAR